MDRLRVGDLDVVRQILSLLGLKTDKQNLSFSFPPLFSLPAASNSTLEPKSCFIGVDTLLVDIELPVSDEVHVTLGTPVVVLLRG